VLGVATLPPVDAPREARGATPAETVHFEAVYDDYFPFVWRSVLRLGVPAAQMDDVVQEIFLVVHRKLPGFEGRSTLKTWLYGIALRVARVHRIRARQAAAAEILDADDVRAPDAARPDEQAQSAEAARVVDALLDELDDDQREVFVLAELEQLTAPEIAEALGLKLNTVYSRLRLARAAFAEAAARHRARDGWRMR
jgi:RNA polymerase sigma-70 factor (ECF subfamily)